MEKWFQDEEVNDLLTKLLDRLCTLERMSGEVYGSTLIFVGPDVRQPVLFARDGKPFPTETLTDQDAEFGLTTALKARLPKLQTFSGYGG